MDFLIIGDIFFQDFSSNHKFTMKINFQKSTIQVEFFGEYFLNKIPNQIKNRNCVENFQIKLKDLKKS